MRTLRIDDAVDDDGARAADAMKLMRAMKARAMTFKDFRVKNPLFFSIFDGFDIKLVANTKVLRGIRHERAADARRWPAWYDLIRIRATDKFDMRARSARVASWDRNFFKKKHWFSYESARARAMTH